MIHEFKKDDIVSWFIPVAGGEGISGYSGQAVPIGNETYEDLRSIGEAYQNFLTIEMPKHNFPLSFLSGKTAQYGIGETVQKVEVKLDRNFKTTGNLWIETQERTRTDIGYSPSGIYRADNSRYYLIGDYEKAFLFQKYQLRTHFEKSRPRQIENGKKTSIGFLLRPEEMRFYILDTFIFGGQK